MVRCSDRPSNPDGPYTGPGRGRNHGERSSDLWLVGRSLVLDTLQDVQGHALFRVEILGPDSTHLRGSGDPPGKLSGLVIELIETRDCLEFEPLDLGSDVDRLGELARVNREGVFLLALTKGRPR